MDLQTWTRRSLPVWRVDSLGAWAAKNFAGPPFAGEKQMRDPFVMPDPTHPNRWLLYYVAVLRDRFPNLVVAVAQSVDSSLDGRWRDVGPILTTDASHTFESQIESPHVFNDHGKWWLFFSCANHPNPLAFETISGSPVDTIPADTSRWGLRYRLTNYLAVHDDDAAIVSSTWHASEYLSVKDREFICGWDGGGVCIAEMIWYRSGPDSFTIVKPTPVDGVGPERRETRHASLFVPAVHPGGGELRLVWDAPRAGALRIELFDVLGRRVRTLVDGELPSGRSTISWNGRDPGGRRMGSGLFFARWTSAQGNGVARVPLIW
jgi:hypothetical protein